MQKLSASFKLNYILKSVTQPAKAMVVIASILAQFSFPIIGGITADTSAFLPNGIGNYNDWSVNSGNKVDAVTANDGNATYISTSSNNKTQTFSVANASIPVGSIINSVTLNVVAAKESEGNASIQLIVEQGTHNGDKSADISYSLTTDYITYSHSMTTNPLTRAAWTVTEVNSWTTKFGVTASVSNHYGHGQSGVAKVTQIYITIDYSSPISNPSLNQSCGLDIALVMDNSGSIGSDLGAMKTDFKNFVDTFLPSTPTEFSVTYFNNLAYYTLQNFNNNANTIKSAINNVPSANGSTNWESGLIKAQATFASGRTDAPNLIVFASDGSPNRYGNGQGVGSETDPAALAAAIAEANLIKSSGTRIITLGIGNSVNTANLQAISSTDAYYAAADFDSLQTALQQIATNLCGGTITVTKMIGTTSASGWTFNIGGIEKITDVNGQTDAVNLTNGVYNVTETQQPGYALASASCTGAANNGILSENGITGIQITTNNIVSCVFYNSPLPECKTDSDCNDGLYCNGQETCAEGSCVAGTIVDCSNNNISAVETCDNNPFDSNQYTWDYLPGFTSQCDENTNSCTNSDSIITSTCSVENCQAQCDTTHSCPDTICSQQSGCQGNNYYAYENVLNTCTEGCTCTENSCSEPIISYNDQRCTECQTNENCSSLTRDYCDGTAIKHDEGICENYTCVASTKVIQECNDGLACNGQETCNNAQCVSGIPVDCLVNNLSEIATCTNDPDGNPFTWDYRSLFTSVCQESSGICSTATIGEQAITHVCDLQCGGCINNTGCDDQNPNTTDVCNLNTCQCEHNQNPPVSECTSGQTKECSTGLQGICSAGTQTCEQSGSWGSCVQNYQPGTEICNDQLDNDCDGAIDSADSDCQTTPQLYCGDGTCNNDENCSSCSQDCGTCGGGGGGGEVYINIFYEKNGNITTATAIVSWETNILATSRVVYDTVPHLNLGSDQNYGYAYSTPEDLSKVLSHSVTITGLNPGITYYWRAISHGSGEAWGREIAFTTTGQSSSGGTECTPSLTRVCDTGKAGICADGTQACDQTGLWGTCVQNTQATTEICGNGMDDNCNGLIDNADPACQQAVTNPVPTPSVSPVSPTPIAPVEIKIIPTPANESISTPTPTLSPEGITQENPARTGLLLAAIGNFFKGNVCRILNLAMIILIILGMLSLWRKVRNSKGKERKIALALFAVISVIAIFILVRYWQNCFMAIPLALIAVALSIINKLLKKEQIIQIPQVK